MDLTCLSRISLSLENNKNDSLITLFIGFATKNRKNMTPHHEMDLNSLVLRDLKATYVLTRDRREHKNYISKIKSLENLVTDHKIKWYKRTVLFKRNNFLSQR